MTRLLSPAQSCSAVALLCAVPAVAPAKPAPDAVGEAPLIPRKILFGNPDTTNVAISPDGRSIAFLRPVGGVLNLWVAPFDRPGAARALTRYSGRGISTWPGPRWAANGRDLLFLRDEGGNENFQLFTIPAAGGDAVNLTRNPQVRTELHAVSPRHPDEVAVGFNDRDPRYHDIYRVNLRTGERTLVAEAGTMTEIVLDDDLRPVLARHADDDGGYTFYRRADGAWQKMLKRPLEDAFSGSTVGVRSGGDVLLIDSGDSDKANLVAVDPVSGAVKRVASGGQADIAAVLRDEVSGAPLAVAEEFLTRKWRPVDPRYAADLAAIGRQLAAPFDIVSHSRDNRRWIVSAAPQGRPERYYGWDRRTRRLGLLYAAYPQLDRARLAPMRAVLLRSQDGLPLTSYLTLPAGSDRNGDGVPDRPLPLVLNVHGGPWGRDSLGFVPESQWLANRGYAVLSINFRGSTGMGKRFINAANFEWAGKMHRDLTDGVAWAIRKGIAQADKVAIYGLSYGGYSALVGLTFTPKTFACAVDMSGPVNLVTTFQTTPPYWAAFREQLKRRVGDVETEEGRKLLLSRSPNMFADRVERPLLIGQGANDPRVKKAEPDQMVAALKARGIPVAYIVYADEGHVFQRPESRASFFAAAEKLYGGCLGGRVEPVGDDHRGARMEIVEGRAMIAD